jgi:hypothetical protein
LEAILKRFYVIYNFFLAIVDILKILMTARGNDDDGNSNSIQFNSIQFIYLQNLTAERPITKLAQARKCEE